LTVFADPAQAVYDNGFQWTQKELKPSGGNVRWLRKNYRSTREIYDLARPLLEGSDDLTEDLSQMQVPERRGPRPRLIVAASGDELLQDVCAGLLEELRTRPPAQIAVLAGSHRLLRSVSNQLVSHAAPVQLVERGRVGLEDPAVKLLTLQSAKGLDFPCVFVLMPGVRATVACDEVSQESRRTLYVGLTRATEQLWVGAVHRTHRPLLDLLPTDSCDMLGSQATAYTNTRGASPDVLDALARQEAVA
jgi:superfamily I DNA/RNA helicase